MNSERLLSQDADIEQLACTLVLTRHGQRGLTPGDAAGLARECLEFGAVDFPPDARRAISGAACGVLKGYLALELDAAAAAVVIAREAPAFAPDLEPAEPMTWALEGAARVSFLAGKKHESDIRDALDEHLAGAGEVFQRACDGLNRATPA